VWDYLSLVLCMTPVSQSALDDVPLGGGARGTLRISGDGARGMRLDPFPLDGPVTLRLDARPVIGAPFDSDSDLQHALAAAPYHSLAFTIEG
jgi:hypothetical protein